MIKPIGTICFNRPVIRVDQDDIIYKTRTAKYKAVIDEIVSLTQQGRPVLVGTVSVEVSELISRMLRMRGIKHQVLNAKQHAREAEVVAHAGEAGTVTIATNMAGRGTDIKLTDEVRKAGGLAIIGTERHDSRRVDRQLRGRAGRQGDPGSSVFYVSLEDNLMRLFGAERVSRIVDRLGLKDDEALHSSALSGMIERAQKRVEENNFGIRKRLLEYDDVMNAQRKAIYGRRRNALNGERIEIDLANMIQDMADFFIDKYGEYDYGSFSYELMKVLSIEPPFDEKTFEDSKKEELSGKLVEAITEAYDRRMETMMTQTYPVIKNVYETQGAIYENIAIPISDGMKALTIAVNLRKSYETGGKEIVRSLAKTIMLYQIDEHWKQHLRNMDDLKQSVQNATYEQKDPLLIYKVESYGLFKETVQDITSDVLSFLLRAFVPLRQNPSVRESVQRRTDMSQMQTSRNDLHTNGGEPKSNAPIRVEKKVGRNDPCPCGSGKKYKNCCGKNAQ